MALRGSSGTIRGAPIPPVVPPPSVLCGADLDAYAPRIGESLGSTVSVSTNAALVSALGGGAPNGSTINITSSLNGGGAVLNITRNASAGGPITITRSPGVPITNYSHWNVTGTYLRFRGLDVGSGTIDGIKLTGASDFCELDACIVHHNISTPPQFGSGVLVTGSAQNWQVWNCVIYTNGNTANVNKDHGMYAAWARGKCVIANTQAYNNCTYNFQLYPDVPGLIVTGCTLDGGQVHAGGRGGIIVGSNTGLTDGVRIYGSIITNAPSSAISPYDPVSGDTDNQVYDCIGFGNGTSPEFVTGGGLAYTHCTHADPLYNSVGTHDYRPTALSPAISYADSSRAGWLPSKYRTGEDRDTLTIGSEVPA